MECGQSSMNSVGSNHPRCLDNMRCPPPPYEITLLDLDNESERAYMMNSWILSYSEHHRGDHRGVIDAILGGDTLVLAAREVASPSTLLGYVVIERIDAGLVLHWCNTKSKYRRAGIATDLIEAALGYLTQDGARTQIYYSHKTRLSPVAERRGMVYLSLEDVA